MKHAVSVINKAACILLAALLAFSGCTSQVIITKPYDQKLRIGDGIKLTVKDGTIHSGRIVYLDRGSVVIRTPKQKTAERPVEVARFGTTIPWSEVVQVRVTGTLDSQSKLISNEEIRANRRTSNWRHMGVNIGLLGTGASFLLAAYLQNKVSPTTTDLSTYNHGLGRLTFWSTFLLGSFASVTAGYKFGKHLDRNISIARIERQRKNERDAIRRAAEARADSLNKAKNLQDSTSLLKF